ncbi:MAG: CsbD family protein, partial [Limnothrix sp.]
FFKTAILSTLAAATLAFGFNVESSSAAPLSVASSSNVQGELVAFWDSAKNKAIEDKGKIQEILGEAENNPALKAKGQLKQVDGKARDAVSDVVRSGAQLENRAKARSLKTNVEGKIQSKMGDMNGSIGDQVVGGAKQLESDAINAVENLKDMAQDVLD